MSMKRLNAPSIDIDGFRIDRFDAIDDLEYRAKVEEVYPARNRAPIVLARLWRQGDAAFGRAKAPAARLASLCPPLPRGPKTRGPRKKLGDERGSGSKSGPALN